MFPKLIFTCSILQHIQTCKHYLSLIHLRFATATWLSLLPAAICFFGCENRQDNVGGVTDSTILKYEILRILPHDERAFTEGLEFVNGKLLESTGMNNQSWIAEVDPVTGEHHRQITLDKEYFGEGITAVNNKLYQLTYREKTGFVYDALTYKKLGEFRYDWEGWGMTHDDEHLIISDGTDKLRFIDTTTLKVVRTIRVRDTQNIAVKNINELEYVDGHIFANVYGTPLVIKIAPLTGQVNGQLDLTAITKQIKSAYPNSLELNGIAYDRQQNAFLVTGKYWPHAYLLRIQ